VLLEERSGLLVVIATPPLAVEPRERIVDPVRFGGGHNLKSTEGMAPRMQPRRQM